MTFEELEVLQPDWDDEGALAPHPKAIENARKGLEDWMSNADGWSFPYAPAVSACADGSVDLFWNNDEFKFLANYTDRGEISTSHEFFLKPTETPLEPHESPDPCLP